MSPSDDLVESPRQAHLAQLALGRPFRLRSGKTASPPRRICAGFRGWRVCACKVGSRPPARAALRAAGPAGTESARAAEPPPPVALPPTPRGLARDRHFTWRGIPRGRPARAHPRRYYGHADSDPEWLGARQPRRVAPWVRFLPEAVPLAHPSGALQA
jgi:hypothetical protein